MIPEKRDPGFRNGGFTLIELVVAVAIVAVVALFAVRKTGSFLARGRIAAAESDMRVLAGALRGEEGSYLSDMGALAGISPAFVRLANLFAPTNLYGTVQSSGEAGRGLRIDADPRPEGVVAKEELVSWNVEAGRGWRGPYVSMATMPFPSRESRRGGYDDTFAERGFYPELSGLWLPRDFTDGIAGASIYGFPGECVPADPWGNPYVLQIPPAQAFSPTPVEVPDSLRFRYARIVSAGPDGRLDTPCYTLNRTNSHFNAWSRRTMLLSRQAGRNGGDVSMRGDDLVLFLERADVDEGEEAFR